jgi:hypothetical protein
MPYPDLKLRRLLALNGIDTPEDFARRTLIKTVEP